MEKKYECEFCEDVGYVWDIQFDEDSKQYVRTDLLECDHPIPHEGY